MGNYNFDIFNYNTIFKVRVDNIGGGVAIIIKNNIKYEKIINFDHFESELVGVKLTHSDTEMVIFSLYNPPNKLLNLELLDKIEESFPNFLICGDLNAKSNNLIKTLHDNNSNGDILEEFILNSNAIIINNDTPTFHIKSRDYHEILDLAIVSPLIASASDFEVLDSEFLDSDHSPIEISIRLKIDRVIEQVDHPRKLNFTKTDWDKFKIELGNFELIGEIAGELDVGKFNINNYAKKMSEHITLCAENCTPFFEGQKNVSELPKFLIDTIKLKRYWRRRFEKTKNPEDLAKYRHLLVFIRFQIKKIKEEKWDNFLVGLKQRQPVSTKPFWQRINKFRNKKAPKMSTINFENKSYESDEDKANLFANKYKKVFSDTNNPEFDNNFKNTVEDFIQSKEYENMYSDKSIKFFSPKELDEVIKNIIDKKSLDSENICNAMIKNLSEDFKLKLLKLINHCLINNIIPDDWKKATISMIPKKGCPKSIDNYRPISITPCLAKIFEKLILERIKKHLKDNNIIIQNQSGFRQNRQTKDNIFNITQKVMESFNRGKKVCCIFFDISAAFDKVWHKGLIYKLINIKLPMYLVNWIISFLEDRKFRIKIGNYTTNYFDVGSGVPQGSVLSPLLFSIYINDIPTNIKRNVTNSLVFADDLAYYHIYKKGEGNVSKLINKHLNTLTKWMGKWRLSFAPHKCNYLVFSKNNINESEKLKLRLNNTLLKYDNNPTFLGIRFDNHLTFINQIKYLQQTCNQRLNIIKILSHSSWKLSVKSLVNIYYTLIRSVIDYSAIISPVICKTNFNHLQIIQNNALRTILHVKKIEHLNIDELHRRAGVEKLDIRLNSLRKKYIDKAIETNNPLIKETITEFNGFKSRVIRFPTPLCDLSV